MEQEKKERVMVNLGLDPKDASGWWEKYKQHERHSVARGLDTELTFGAYIRKAVEAGLTNPTQIGVKADQYQLGRIGDVGCYEDENTRFITSGQNSREAHTNGRLDAFFASRRGATKETNASFAAQANKVSKNYEVTSPTGEVFRGRNLNEFCKQHDLDQAHMARMCNGIYKQHKGWTGTYLPE